MNPRGFQLLCPWVLLRRGRPCAIDRSIRLFAGRRLAVTYDHYSAAVRMVIGGVYAALRQRWLSRCGPRANCSVQKNMDDSQLSERSEVQPPTLAIRSSRSVMSAPLLTVVAIIGVAVMVAVTRAGTTSPIHAHGMIWLLSGSGINKLAASRGGPGLLRGPLNRASTWVYGKSRSAPPRSTPLSGGTRVTAIRRGARRPGHYLLLDIENWKFTPMWERRNPVAACRAAARFAARAKKVLIVTPAFDLIRALKPQYRGRIYPEFIRLRIAARLARFVGVYEIQAQGCENNLRLYRWVVRRISRQVRRVSPRVLILAGLSTGPSGQRTSAGQLFADVNVTRRYVNGYRMNIPGKGPYCPRCGRPKPQIAIRFFRRFFGAKSK